MTFPRGYHFLTNIHPILRAILDFVELIFGDFVFVLVGSNIKVDIFQGIPSGAF